MSVSGRSVCDWEEDRDHRGWNSSHGNIPGGNNIQNHLGAQAKGTFIEKIIVHEKEKVDGKRRQTVEIIYNCVGAIPYSE